MNVDVATAPGRTVPVPAELEFLQPPPGMLGLYRFTLSPLDEAGFLFALRSDDDPSVRLFLVPPGLYFPDYAPRLDQATVEALGAGGDEDADGGTGSEQPVLLVVVHPGHDGSAPTANLLAPVVLSRSGRAAQVVLDGDEWPLRAPLSASSSAA